MNLITTYMTQVTTMKTDITKIALLGLSLSFGLMASPLSAKTIDVSAAQKDIRIMQGILESSIEASKADIKVRPSIRSTYLAKQGVLFSIRLNNLGLGGMAAWEDGRLELDIPEIIGEAFAAVEAIDPVAPIAPEDLAALEELEAMEFEFANVETMTASKEHNEKLKAMRERQREIRSETYRLSREMRRHERDTDEYKRLSEQLVKSKEQLEQEKNAYRKALEEYRQVRMSSQIATSDQAIDFIMQTFCDYGQTMRNLEKNEKINLLFEGGVAADGNKASQMFVFDAADIKGCKNVSKLREQALYYTL